jgi:hypothetical protein
MSDCGGRVNATVPSRPVCGASGCEGVRKPGACEGRFRKR